MIICNFIKVGKVSDFRKIMISFKIVTFKRFVRKIVKFKQIIVKFWEIVTVWADFGFKIVTFQCFGRKIVKFKQIILNLLKIVTFWANHYFFWIPTLFPSSFLIAVQRYCHKDLEALGEVN